MSRAEFHKEFQKALEEKLMQLFDARSIESGPLYDAIAELAQKGDMKPPRLLLSKSGIPQAAALINAGPNQGRILLTQGLLDSFGITPQNPTSREFTAIVAHELGHSKLGQKDVYAKRLLPMFGLPAALVAGRHTWLAFQEHSPEEEARSYANRLIIHLASDGLLAAGGYVAGSKLAAHNSVQSEFFCDRFAAKLVGPEAIIASLKTIDKSIRDPKIINSAANSDPLKAMTYHNKGGSTVWDTLKNWHTRHMHAHPSLQQRVQALQKEFGIGESLARSASTVTQAASAVVSDASHAGRLVEVLSRIR